MSEGADRYLVPGLVRGLKVLALFTPNEPDLSLADIARRLGTSRSAAFRTVYTLEAMGCLRHDGVRHTYALGPGVLRLGYGFRPARELVEIAQPVLARLRDEMDWSAHLGVREGVCVHYVLRVPGRTDAPSIVQVGSRLPARSTSLGRVLLAHLDEDDLIALYKRNEAGLAPGRIAAIVKQARVDRDEPAVVHLGDFEAGIASVAAPVRDRDGAVIAAINVVARHTAQTAKAIETDVCARLIGAADALSTLLGAEGRGDGR